MTNEEVLRRMNKVREIIVIRKHRETVYQAHIMRSSIAGGRTEDKKGIG